MAVGASEVARTVARLGETVDQDVEHRVRGVRRCVTHGAESDAWCCSEREAPSLAEVLTHDPR